MLAAPSRSGSSMATDQSAARRSLACPVSSRCDTAYPNHIAVWRFETGLSPLRANYDQPVTLVEIWPGAVPLDVTLGSVHDEAHVRSLVRWCVSRDARGDWAEWLAPASAKSAVPRVLEEGWILGIR